MHQKSVVLHGRDIAVFGSSNWTGSSSDTQREHNYFTRKTWFVDWFAAQFLRKWNNLRIDGTAISPTMFQDLAPGSPQPPVNVSPANGAFDLGTSVSLRWEGGWWAHKYNVRFGYDQSSVARGAGLHAGRGDRGRPFEQGIIQSLLTSGAIRLGLSVRADARNHLLLEESTAGPGR